MSVFVIGIGSSGVHAEKLVHHALGRLESSRSWRVLSRSELYANPAVGNATHARFVNAAVVVETHLVPRTLLLALFAIENEVGRIRTVPNAARTLDLDILWSPGLMAPLDSPAIPHPRLLERPFAAIPALEALKRAGRFAQFPLVEAARRLSCNARMEMTKA